MPWQVRREMRELRHILNMFPDRATFEQWLATRAISEAHRAHLEQFLPDRLKAQGTV